MIASARKMPQRQSVRGVHVSAPIGGVNTVNAGSDMPASDCIYAYNLIAAEYGLRSRLGYREWCTGLDGEVRSVLPFTGSKASGSANRLFACTTSGIWDVSASSQAPTKALAFPSSTTDSGWGIAHVFVTLAGHFLLYCDEEHGYFVYSEATDTWTKVIAAATVAWAPTTAYIAGDARLNGGLTYVCTVGGVSAGAGGPAGTGTAIVDGAATWTWAPALAGVDPAKLAFVTSWKSRVWLVERDSARAWYLDVNAVFGTATAFNFGTKFRAGGDLRCLASWTYDGGAGIDDSLVAISGGGDVVIFQGTDPSSASSFAMKGVWYVGGVPAGRQLTTNFGGDLLILSSIGVLPLSTLTVGKAIIDRSQYATQKIANLFNVLAQTYGTVRGWSLRLQPQDNALLVTVPSAEGQATTQLAMALATRGWTQYRDLPISSAEVWGGQLYFGTPDGRVCVNDGYVDGVLLTEASAFTPVQWSLLTSFQNLGTPRQKRVQMLRPKILSQSVPPTYEVAAKFRYDLSELAPIALANGAKGTWDHANWDADVWAGEYSLSQPTRGATGMGVDVALAMRGTAIARTTIVGVDVLFDLGGFL